MYDLKLRVQDRRISVTIDGNEYLSVTERPAEVERLYHSAALDEEDGSLILKVVNLQEKEETAQIRLDGPEKMEGRGFPVTARVFTMTGRPEQENSFEEPEAVSPVQSSLTLEGESFSYRFPALSLTVIRIPARG